MKTTICKETKYTIWFKLEVLDCTMILKLSRARYSHLVRFLKDGQDDICLRSELGEQLLNAARMRNIDGIYSGNDFLNYLGYITL